MALCANRGIGMSVAPMVFTFKSRV